MISEEELKYFFHLLKEHKTKIHLFPESEKILYILRGIPGTGKSTKIRKIMGEKSFKQTKKHVFSNDFYRTMYNDKPWFEYTDQQLESPLQDQKYDYFLKSPRQIAELILENLEASMKKNVTPLLIDNTNIEDWELMTFCSLAIFYEYNIIILENVGNYLLTQEKTRNILDKILLQRSKKIQGKTIPRQNLQEMIHKMIETQNKLMETQSPEKYLERIMTSDFPDYAARTENVDKGLEKYFQKIKK